MLYCTIFDNLCETPTPSRTSTEVRGSLLSELYHHTMMGMAYRSILLPSSFLSVPLFEQRFIQLLQLRGDGLVATFGRWVTILELVEKGLKMQLGALGR